MCFGKRSLSLKNYVKNNNPSKQIKNIKIKKKSVSNLVNTWLLLIIIIQKLKICFFCDRIGITAYFINLSSRACTLIYKTSFYYYYYNCSLIVLM